MQRIRLIEFIYIKAKILSILGQSRQVYPILVSGAERSLKHITIIYFIS